MKAGSGAVLVVWGETAVPPELPGAGVGALLVEVLEADPVAVVWVLGGAPATDTVLVWDPHAASTAAAARANEAGRARLIARMVFAGMRSGPRLGGHDATSGYDQSRRMSAQTGHTRSEEGPGPVERPRRNRKDLARQGGIAVLAVLITLFAVLNTEKVEVDWVIGSGHAPLIIVIVISVLVGIVIAYLAERRSRKRR